jgi:hypothetical protein
MARKTTPSTPSTSTPTATATPKFRAVDALQLSTHIKKMDSIHIAKSTVRKFEHFVNLSVDDIAGILADTGIENVNAGINLLVNAKTVDGIKTAISNGTVTELTVRKK